MAKIASAVGIVKRKRRNMMAKGCRFRGEVGEAKQSRSQRADLASNS